MNIIDLPYGFEPRDYQLDMMKAIFVECKKHIIFILHRRAGKTINALNIMTALAHREVGLYFHTFPEQRQARKIIWDGFDSTGRKYLDYIPKELIKRINNQEMLIEFKNGSIFQLAGTDRYDSLVGSNPKWIIYDEYSLQNPMARVMLRPVLSENDGGEIFVYTPRGRNHGYKLYESNKNNPDWYAVKLGADRTRKLDGSLVMPKEKIDELRNEGLPEEIIQQEYFCSFDVEMPGSVFGSWIGHAESEKRIREIKIEKDLPVFTWWDIGWNDDTVIVFMQPFGGELRFIHCYNNRKQDIPHYAEYLREFARKHQIKYKYHFPPHDINVHEWGSGRTRFHIAHDNGIQFQPPVKRLDHTDGREALRSVLKICHFDAIGCETLINALRDYHYDYDSKNALYKKQPVHDWSSHFADAMMYFAVTWNTMFRSSGQQNSYVYSY